MFWKISLVLGLLLITTSFSFLNDAEARGSGEPCSYLNLHSFIKISNDPWKCEKVSYWVPEVCGKTEGLYLTDSRCQAPSPPPPPQPQSQSQPVTPAAAMPNPTSNSGTSYYQGVNDLHTSPQQVNCGAGTVLRNNVCVAENTSHADVTLPAFPAINPPAFDWELFSKLAFVVVVLFWSIFWAVRLYRRRSQRRDDNVKDIIELTTDGHTQRSVTIANQNTVTAEVAKRIREYENDFNIMGQCKN